ncbi:bifunctional folylpolyglutamate synthase/dihydrofolate synthase [Aquimarina rhabdastrellae]
MSMNYRETLQWMFAQLPIYQRQGAKAYKIDLSNTTKLAKYLGNPERNFKSVHIGGTNGKGSTSHLISSIMQEAGYKVGLYTSPHLKDFRERIRINGKKIKKKYVKQFIAAHKPFFEKEQCSFFEMTVGMAFRYFADESVDIAIIEVGLGGRLDSTNIITPEVAVITNIGLDHTQFLGTTITEIAGEKAGIIKNDIPVVIGNSKEDAEKVFLAKAKETKSEMFFAKSYTGKLYPTALKGNYQKENVKTTLQTISVLQNKGWNITDTQVQNGLLNVIVNTKLLGRWQVIQEHPKVICDTGHNEDGLRWIMKQLEEEKYKRLHIVLGVVNDKKLDEILPLFPQGAQYYFAKPSIPRGLDAIKLKEEATFFNLTGKKFKSIKKAYKAALQSATDGDLIFVGGSTFVVAEII